MKNQDADVSPALSNDALAQIPKKISLHSQLPAFKDVPANQKTILFISKLRQCNKLVRIDDQELRKLKHLVLYQLLEYINTQNNAFPLDAIPDFFNTVAINIFRQAPKPQAEDEDVYDPEEDEPLVDANWYHLQFVYEMLLRFVYSAQTQQVDYQKAVKRFIDCDFVVKLMQLFNQSDPRERDYVKTILHRVYANIMSLRAFVRLTLKSELQSYFSGAQQHSGICDVLEVLGSIINGYAVPLKPEHTQFLSQCLVPLHRVQFIKHILPQLSYCVSKFIEKEPSLSGYIINQILGFYPRLNSHKEVSLLTEVEELLELVPPEQMIIKNFQQMAEFGIEINHPLQIYKQLFDTVAQAMCSLHFQVAEKSINMISNQKFLLHIQNAYTNFLEIFGERQQTIYEDVEAKIYDSPKNTNFASEMLKQSYNPISILGKALKANSAHWNSNIRFLAEQSLKQLNTLNQREVQLIDQKILSDCILREYKRQSRDAYQVILAQKALENAKQFGTYFKLQATKENINYVPGYQPEIVMTDKVLSSSVPEDPLFCRTEEMSLKYLNISPEFLIGAIEGVMQEYPATPGSPQLTSGVEETEADKCFKRGIDLMNDDTLSNICQKTYKNLVSSTAVTLNETEFIGQKTALIQPQMPTKRLANRRASAGVVMNMGIRRKSVVPLNASALQAKQELDGFEKHKIGKE
ncbi:Protein_phosphatase 2A regulatory subunit [Hexamita inflata]|uniref:Protein phosphatase 2A regulatory subunit n=1 Tax=Hexamita inflata TaxID=28002 RepID=A0AA86QS55_9EUKA|nr:Protein phosphatase 2A regulatory subunit [Hexamita inflata]CAI9974769.1 Protein phosphatase 2A regulatory subunit [Hexamita inflata]